MSLSSIGWTILPQRRRATAAISAASDDAGPDGPGVRGPSSTRRARVLGAATIAFSSILVRLSHASPSTAAIFRCAYALPVLRLLVLRRGPAPRRRAAGASAASALLPGVFFAVDLLLWNRSIVDVGAGLATVLANIQVVLVPLVAWALLSERAGAARAVGAAGRAARRAADLRVSSSTAPSGATRAPGRCSGSEPGVAYVGFLLLLRHGGADLRRPAGPLFDATPSPAFVCIAAGLVIGDARSGPDLARAPAGWSLLALSSQVIGWLLIRPRCHACRRR